MVALAMAMGFLALLPATARAAEGGPVVLDGMDPVCHANMGEATGNYIQSVLTSVHDQAGGGRDGSIAVLGASADSMFCGFMTPRTLADNMAAWTADIAPEPNVTFHASLAEVEAFLAAVRAGTAKPSVIYMPDNSREPGVEAEFTASATTFADHVNAGGALFSHMGEYGWLTALLPDALYINGGCNGGPAATTAGTDAFGLTDAIVVACWHGFFEGDLGALTPLVDWTDPRGGDGRVAVAIGGASVTLPSAFSLEGPVGPAEVGTMETVVATLQDGEGGPIAGESVTFEVTSGPNAGQTRTVESDAAGAAQFTFTSAVRGTDIVTASVTVGGEEKTASHSLQWLRRPAAPSISNGAIAGGTLTVDVLPASVDDDAALSEIRVTITPGDIVSTLPAAGGSTTISDLANDILYTVSAVATNVIGDGPSAETTVIAHSPRIEVASEEGLVGRAQAVVITLEHFRDADELFAVVSLPAGNGSITLDATGLDLTLLDGYSSFTSEAIAFTGPAAEVASALAERVTWTLTSAGNVSLSASISEDPAALGTNTTRSATASATLTAKAAPPVDEPEGGILPPAVRRIGGVDRDATAAKLSASTFAPGVPVVYVVTGSNFADGLTAGVVSGLQGGPVLLAGETLSAATLAELQRLEAGRIVIVGQGGAVNEDVEKALASYTEGAVTRIGGTNRYATAALLSSSHFTAGAEVAYIATGDDFADSLSGGAAAARNQGPILLVGHDGPTPEILAELERVDPDRVVVLGGTAAVSTDIVDGLKQATGVPFTRIGGADRYETSALIAEDTFPGTVDVVYLATGTTFADAMTAPTAVFKNDGVLLLTDPEQLPTSVAATLARLSPNRIVILGGQTAISDAVADAAAQHLR